MQETLRNLGVDEELVRLPPSPLADPDSLPGMVGRGLGGREGREGNVPEPRNRRPTQRCSASSAYNLRPQSSGRMEMLHRREREAGGGGAGRAGAGRGGAGAPQAALLKQAGTAAPDRHVCVPRASARACQPAATTTSPAQSPRSPSPSSAAQLPPTPHLLSTSLPFSVPILATPPPASWLRLHFLAGHEMGNPAPHPRAPPHPAPCRWF